MFRRKDSETSQPGGSSEGPGKRPASEPQSKSAGQPELPRRKVDIPTAPTAPASNPRQDVATTTPPAPQQDTDGKHLIVGRGIQLKGEITACDLLIVEGSVEVTLNETLALEIRESGRFVGGCEVEEAEISGLYEGQLKVRNRLLIHSSGRVKGDVEYGEIEVERGGHIGGNVSMIEDQRGKPTATIGPKAAQAATG